MLPDGRGPLDIACSDGRIVAVEAGIDAGAERVIDAGGVWFRRLSSTAIFTWTRRSRSDCRA